ncbi:uncharacterized protein LOC110814051 [Carica papaya]|uniref:uncharacterized protein LOC110814051 n=1 Tax=Carica papaya TaxID=3649 RepID=UPI000B8CABAE|nr:uncharacterized protein LOC110814051 [Carica papaya]
MDLTECLKQSSSFPSDTCCSALNQAVQAGYNCLCLLLALSLRPSSQSLYPLPFQSCYISVPSLTLCRVLTPLPIVLPPNIPKNVGQIPPFVPPNATFNTHAPPTPYPPKLNSTRNITSSTGGSHGSNENAIPKSIFQIRL